MKKRDRAAAALPALGSALGLIDPTVGILSTSATAALSGWLSLRGQRGLEAIWARVDDQEGVLRAIEDGEESAVHDVLIAAMWASTRCSEEKLEYLANVASNGINSDEVDDQTVLMLLDVVDRMTATELLLVLVIDNGPGVTERFGVDQLVPASGESRVTILQIMRAVFGDGFDEFQALMTMTHLHSLGLTEDLADDMAQRRFPELSQLGKTVLAFIQGPDTQSGSEQ